MHPKAIQKINKITNGALQNCSILNRWPQFQSYSEHVESLSKEVLKHKNEWLIDSDIYSIFIDHVYRCLLIEYPEDSGITGDLKDLLSLKQFNELTDSISKFIESIPREYDVYLPLPSLSEIEFESLELHDGVWIKSFNKPESIPGGYQQDLGLLSLPPIKFEQNKVYLCIREKGYCGGSVENSCTREALSGFKLLLHAGVFRVLFRLEEMKSVDLGLMGRYDHHQIPKISLVSVDLNAREKRVINTELPLNLTRFIHKIYLSLDSIKKAKETDKEHFKSHFLNILKKSAQLTQQKTEHSSPIKSAIEWAIDSRAEENQTLSFIQNCIGLECVLGEDSGGLPITATLADRCSYLLGTDPKSRKTIRKKFKDLYEIRSKLVHGNVSRLSKDASEYHRWGQAVLDFAIAKEIKNYKIEEI